MAADLLILSDDAGPPTVLEQLTIAGAPLVAGTNTAADSMISLSGADHVFSAYSGYKPLTYRACF